MVEEELELLLTRSFPYPRRFGVEAPPFDHEELAEHLDNQWF